VITNNFKTKFASFRAAAKKSSLRLEASLFITLFSIGLILVPTYGIGWDEYGGRAHGTYNVVGILRFLAPSLVPSAYKNFPTLDEWYAYTHGAWFEILLSSFEVLLRLEGLHEIYIMRHILTFSFCFFGLINFYYFIKRSFDNPIYSLFALCFAILSPRIFADSFYNNKDTIFMSLMAILMNRFSLFLTRGDAKSLLLLALAAGLMSGLRIVGLALLPFILVGILYRAFTQISVLSQKYTQGLKNSLIFLIVSFCTLILSMPYLWSQPLRRLLKIVKENRNFDWPGFVRFDGIIYSAKDLPWNYLPKWILITTPPIFLLLAAIGFFLLGILPSTKNRSVKCDKTFLITIQTFTAAFMTTIIVAIASNSTLYGGWRHFYFIYPTIISLSILGLSGLMSSHFKALKFLATFIIAVQVLNVAGWTIRNHPHQNLYFNSFAGSIPAKNWDFDYWGTTNTEVLRWILKEDLRDSFSVSSNIENPLGQSEKLLSPSELQRIVFLRGGLLTEPDYFIDNFMGTSAPNVEREITNYRLIKQFRVDSHVYTSIYLRI
jgi:hypothetical protein